MQEIEKLRRLPVSLEAEKAVLGGIFLIPNTFEELIEIISPNDFYKNAHGLIFQAMIDIYASGKEIDPILVRGILTKKNQFENVGGEDILIEIISEVSTAVNLSEYAKIIKEKAILRRLGEAGIKITEMAYKDDRDAEDILDEAESLVSLVSENKQKNGVISLKDAALEEITRLENLQNRKGEVLGISSGFSYLDKMTNGFNNSDLIIIGARPAMGKTSFALNIAFNAAKKSDKNVLVFSLEMSTSQLYQRFFSMDSGIPLEKIKSGYLEKDEWAKIGISTSRLADLNINIADISNVNVLEIRALSRRLKSKGELDMIVIDYLQLISGAGRAENRQQVISDISRSLKGLARELDIPIIALSQLSRDNEKRPDKRPVLSDLRESGAIEQDADMVMFLYRDEYYNENTEDKGITELIISKHRNGPTGTVKLRFINELTKFENFTTKV